MRSPRVSAGPIDASAARADDLFTQYQQDIYRHTDRLFAGLMAVQWVAGIVFALWVSPLAWDGTGQPHAPARLGRGRPRRHHLALPRAPRAVPPGLPSTRYTIATAQMLMGGAADPPDGWTDRDALSRLRLARLPHVLSRLARARAGDHRRRAGSPAAGNLLAAVGLRRAGRQPMALAGARGVGRLRRHLPRRLVPAERRGNAAAGGPHGGARAGGPHPAGSGDRRAEHRGSGGRRRPRAHARRRAGGHAAEVRGRARAAARRRLRGHLDPRRGRPDARAPGDRGSGHRRQRRVQPGTGRALRDRRHRPRPEALPDRRVQRRRADGRRGLGAAQGARGLRRLSPSARLEAHRRDGGLRAA